MILIASILFGVTSYVPQQRHVIESDLHTAVVSIRKLGNISENPKLFHLAFVDEGLVPRMARRFSTRTLETIIFSSQFPLGLRSDAVLFFVPVKFQHLSAGFWEKLFGSDSTDLKLTGLTAVVVASKTYHFGKMDGVARALLNHWRSFPIKAGEIELGLIDALEHSPYQIPLLKNLSLDGELSVRQKAINYLRNIKSPEALKAAKEVIGQCKLTTTQ